MRLHFRLVRGKYRFACNMKADGKPYVGLWITDRKVEIPMEGYGDTLRIPLAAFLNSEPEYNGEKLEVCPDCLSKFGLYDTKVFG
jgi:hypothetical protein